MRAKLLAPSLWIALASACGGDVSVVDHAQCDGALQAQETTVDDVFDADGDGYFDADNPGCAATYSEARLDCDDGNPDANPIVTEILCNNIDDDCNPATSDLDDRGCVESYAGSWALDAPIQYSCAMGNVKIDFNLWVITHNDPAVTLTAVGSGVQPGSLSGTVTVQGQLSATTTLSGGCTETYTVNGSFTNPNTFEGSFAASYSGGLGCLDCQARSWDFTATR